MLGKGRLLLMLCCHCNLLCQMLQVVIAVATMCTSPEHGVTTCNTQLECRKAWAAMQRRA